jgi:hypothetical protein
LKNEDLEKALEETWKNKEKFYEDTKGLSMLEIIREIENKYKVRGTAHNRSVCASPPYGGSGSAKHQSG